MNMSLYNEAEFIKKLHQQDTGAFAQLYEEYRDDIYFYINKMVADPDAATGIVADTFSKLWTRIKHFPSIPNMRAFLYTTSRNLAIDFIRRKKSQPDITQSSLLNETVAIVLPTVEAEMTKIAIYKLLNNALDKLEPSQKVILERLFIEEKSIKDICKELNISSDVVWARKSRALKKIREQNSHLFSYFKRLQFSPIFMFL